MIDLVEINYGQLLSQAIDWVKADPIAMLFQTID